MKELEVVNNQTTAVEEIINKIKNMDSKNKEEFKKLFGELQQSVENKHNELDKQYGNFETKMEEKLTKFVDELTKAYKNSAVNLEPDKKEMKYGKDFGEFLYKVRHLAEEVKADLAESSGSTGGYLVPEEFSNEILRINIENSVVRNSGARVINMTSSTLKIPALNMASNAAGSMYGGVAAYWAEESGQLTESEPTFKRILLEPKKLIGYTESSEELNDDALLNLGDLLQTMFGEVLAFEEDYAFLNGDGVGKPLGITVSPAFITVSRNSGSIIVTADIIDMMARFKGDLNRAVFTCNQTSLPYIYKLLDENDNYIWHPGGGGNISKAAPGTLYGVPIKVTEKLPALGTTGDLILGDCGYYLIGDRQGLSVEESMHFKFQNDQLCWKIRKRVDGQCWLNSAITPRAGGSTLSPFVGIG